MLHICISVMSTRIEIWLPFQQCVVIYFEAKCNNSSIVICFTKWCNWLRHNGESLISRVYVQKHYNMAKYKFIKQSNCNCNWSIEFHAHWWLITTKCLIEIAIAQIFAAIKRFELKMVQSRVQAIKCEFI